MPHFLNAFRVTFSSESVQAFSKPVPDPSELKGIRKSLGDTCFSYWHEGTLYTIPKSAGSQLDLGEATPIQLKSYLGMKLVAAMITEALPSSFVEYDPVRDRPFTFLAQKQELVTEATSDWNQKPKLLSDFEIRAKFELDPRLAEIHDGNLEVALVMKLTTRWICNADLKELDAAGVELSGLHILRRNPEPGTRRLIGRVKHLDGDKVVLSDAYDDVDSVLSSDVKLEGSKESFARCLSKILGPRYRHFMGNLDSAQGNLTNGPGLEKSLGQMLQFLKSKNPLQLPGEIECEVSELIEIRNRDDFKSLVYMKPAKYCFDRARTKLTDYAWQGIQKFGPYDRESFPRRTPKILVVCPDTLSGRVSQSIKLFRDGVSSVKNSRYANGFAGAFNLVNPDFQTLPVSLFGLPTEQVSGAYRDAIENHLARDSNYDAAINVLHDEHSRIPDAINPYLATKAVLLANAIPVQETRASTLASAPESLQYIFQNISTALYAKMGGIPWTVDHGETADDEIVIGIGNAELSGSRFESRQRHVGITTVFRGDGNYLLSNVSRECKYDDYPAVLRESTLRVLSEIKQRNAWKPGSTIRIVFHAFKPLKKVEVADIIKSCVEQVGAEQHVEFAFLTITRDHPFTLMDTGQKGIAPRYGNGASKGVYVPARGLLVQIGKATRLLCTNGPRMVKRSTLPLPSPLLIHLHQQSTYKDFPYLADQVLKFTSLSWKSTLPTDRPVTILYSSLIAELLGRLQVINDWSPAVLNTKLKTSKWFL